MRPITTTILLILTLWCGVVRGVSGMPQADFDAMCDRCLACTNRGEGEAAVACADSLLSATASDTLSYDRLTALAYAAQAYLSIDEYETAYGMLRSGLKLWDTRGKEAGYTDGRTLTPLPALFNGAGVYYVSYELDYEKATECFIRGLEFCRDHDLDAAYLVLSYNLIMAYNVREDASGLRHAEEIYARGVATDNARLTCMGAYGTAMMYYHAGKYAEAEKYILKAIEAGGEPCSALVYNVHAMILDATGHTAEAEERFGLALKEIDREPSTSASYVCLSYGKFLNRHGRFAAAAEILRRGLDIAGNKSNKVFAYRLYEALAEAYAGLNRHDRALTCYQRYHQLSDSIFNIGRERNINELTIKYRTALHESEIRRKDVELLKKNHALELSAMIIAVMLAALAVTYGMYRHKNGMYTRIAKQYQDAMRREKRMEEIVSQTQSPARIDKDRSVEIVSKLEELMLGQRIYRDSTLSRDKLAELVGTNRTYLSKVVNEQYGKSVSQLINSCRVNRAVELLSDLGCDMQMKVVEIESGFSSSSSFFRIFKDQVGMSPAKFREKILEIARTQARPNEG